MKTPRPYDFNKHGILLLLLPSEESTPVKDKQTYLGNRPNDRFWHFLLSKLPFDTTMRVELSGDAIISRFNVSPQEPRIAVFPGLNHFIQRNTYRTIVVALTNTKLKKLCFYLNEKDTLQRLPVPVLQSKFILSCLTWDQTPCAIWVRPNVQIRPCMKGYYLKPFNVMGIPKLAKLMQQRSCRTISIT